MEGEGRLGCGPGGSSIALWRWLFAVTAVQVPERGGCVAFSSLRPIRGFIGIFAYCVTGCVWWVCFMCLTLGMMAIWKPDPHHRGITY